MDDYPSRDPRYCCDVLTHAIVLDLEMRMGSAMDTSIEELPPLPDDELKPNASPLEILTAAAECGCPGARRLLAEAGFADPASARRAIALLNPNADA